MSVAHISRVENLLGATALAITDRMRKAGQQGESSRAALVQLAANPGLTVNGLRRRMGLTHSAVVRMLAQLESNGQVERARSTEDKRAVTLRLTPQGQQIATQVLAERGQILHDSLTALTSEQQQVLEGLLDQLLTQLPESADQASEICRLCELRACPEELCPVERSYQQHLDG
jgi:MarR family transcriptional repressor of emrRAB